MLTTFAAFCTPILVVLLITAFFWRRALHFRFKRREPKQRPLKIYFCSPFRGDDEAKNVEFALGCCRQLARAGATVFAPHLFYTRFLDDTDPGERDAGIKSGLTIMADFDEVWFVLPTWRKEFSTGMKHELAAAMDFKKRRVLCLTPQEWLRALERLEWELAHDVRGGR